MNNLHDKYSHFFEYMCGNLLHKPKTVYDVVYFMAIDAEWFASGQGNVVLSYQVATTSNVCATNIIEYVKRGKRLSLPDIVSLGINSVISGSYTDLHRDKKVCVVLLSHNFTAEWSVFADRDAGYITKRLALVRKSPITDGHPIKLVVDNIAVDVVMFDTMLLAPASHQSLANLSKLLGDDDGGGKISIKQREIEHMDQLLRDDPERYELYALRDSEVCLRLFFVLEDALNRLAFGDGEFRQLFRTLASAGVKGFLSLDENSWFKDYLIDLSLVRPPKLDKKERDFAQIQHFKDAYRLIRRAYHGGRNESYLCGNSAEFSETCDRVWIDIDLSSAYPSGMALCPRIDVDGKIRTISLSYNIDAAVVKILLQDGFAPDVIEAAQRALQVSMSEFDQFLGRLKPSSRSILLRQRATVVDNSLIDRWQQQCRDDGNSEKLFNPETYLIPGFARIRFKFPPETAYPCLPIKHYKFGLIYPLSGETVATSIEILLALECGAEIEAITSVELPVVEGSTDGEPDRFFMNHLRNLLTQRAAYKKDKSNQSSKVYERLLKEFANSFYGKFAQAINVRNVYRPATGVMVPLGSSELTEPCSAALTTGMTRAVLSALLIGIDRFNREHSNDDGGKICVVSATTDGLLLGVPLALSPSCPAGYSVEGEYYAQRNGIPILKSELSGDADIQAAMQVENLFQRFNCQELLNNFEKFLPVRQLKYARNELTGSGDYLEVKHLVDEVISVKTRGQVGKLQSGHVPLLARFGHKAPLSEILPDPEQYKHVMSTGGTLRQNYDAAWLEGCIDRANNGENEGLIERYTFINLTSFKKILESNGTLDLTKTISRRRVNTDFDWKRKLLSPTSPNTVAFNDLDEMVAYRRIMEAIRKTGHVAKVEQVLHRITLKQRTFKYRGGESKTLVRHFIRGIVLGHISFNRRRRSYPKLAALLNDAWQASEATPVDQLWSATDFKNAKRATWEAGVLLKTIASVRLLEELVQCFDVDYTEAAGQLFIDQSYNDDNVALVVAVVRALLLAPKYQIEPFYDHYLDGKLPVAGELLRVFQPVLTAALLVECQNGRFVAGECYPHEREALQRLFMRVNISSKDAKQYARILAPVASSRAEAKQNPAKKRCLANFVMALQLPDVNLRTLKAANVVDSLSYFGLTQKQYYALIDGKFIANSLANTPENRRQIIYMSRALRLDANLYIATLLES